MTAAESPGSRWPLWFAGLLAALSLLIALPASGADEPAEVLSNSAVIELKQLGLGDAVIVEKINASTCRFDLTLNGLKGLKTANLSDAVISAMLAASKPVPTAPTATTNRTADTRLVPTFYGLHVVIGNRLVELKRDSTAVEVPADVEFIYHAKSVSLAEMFGLFELPSASKPIPTVRDGEFKGWEDFMKQSEEYSAEIRGQLAGLPRGSVQVELRSASIPEQPEMIRLKPVTALSPGNYQIGIRGGVWYRISVTSQQMGQGLGRAGRSWGERLTTAEKPPPQITSKEAKGFYLSRVSFEKATDIAPVTVEMVVADQPHKPVIIRVTNTSNKRIRITGMNSVESDGKSEFSKHNRSIKAKGSHDFIVGAGSMKADDTLGIQCEGFPDRAVYVLKQR